MPKTREDIENIVCASIERHIGYGDYKSETTLDSLGLDSLDLAVVVMDIEERLNIKEIKIKNFAKLKTINDVIDLVQQWIENESSINNIVKT